jgi:YD repeat-containing protein
MVIFADTITAVMRKTAAIITAIQIITTACHGEVLHGGQVLMPQISPQKNTVNFSSELLTLSESMTSKLTDCIKYTYDTDNNKLTETITSSFDSNVYTTSNTCDSNSNLLSTTNPELQTTNYTYNSDGTFEETYDYKYCGN